MMKFYVCVYVGLNHLTYGYFLNTQMREKEQVYVLFIYILCVYIATSACSFFCAMFLTMIKQQKKKKSKKRREVCYTLKNDT